MSEERPAGSDVLAPFRVADPAYKLSSRVTRSDPRWQAPDALLDAALEATSPDDPALRAAASRQAPPLTLLAALARADLAAGRTAEAQALISRATARDANHLHLQALQRRAAGTGEPPGLAHRFCAAPFENLETNPGGAVYFCCPAWLPVPIGNIGETDAASIWNSRVAQDIRASIHDGSYRYCSRTHCPKLSRATLPDKATVIASSLREAIRTQALRLAHGPKHIVLSHDRSCNLSCPSCRKGLILARKEEQARMNRMADEVLFPLLKDAQRLRVTASGDPFGSAHFQYVLSHLDRAGSPRLRLDLQTNGVLLTPKLWERLRLEGRVEQLIVSVDAAEPETYHQVRRGGSLTTLMENLTFMAEMRRERRIATLRLDFVVQALNFREMPAFVDLARGLGADRVKFQMIRSWGTWSPEEFAWHDISDPAHPDYPAFLEVLCDPRLRAPYAELWGMGVALRDAAAQPTK